MKTLIPEGGPADQFPDGISREQRIAFVESRQPHTVHAALGIRVTNYDPVTVELTVDERHHQETGIVHGGVYVVLAESAASLAAAMEVDLTRFNVAGMSLQSSHLRPVREGRLVAVPELVHAGRSQRIYDVAVTDGDGRLVHITRLTVAVRPWPKG